jgi:hypothetical protein
MTSRGRVETTARYYHFLLFKRTSSQGRLKAVLPYNVPFKTAETERILNGLNAHSPD